MEVRIDAFDTRNRQHLDELPSRNKTTKRYFNTRLCLSDKERILNVSIKINRGLAGVEVCLHFEAGFVFGGRNYNIITM